MTYTTDQAIALAREVLDDQAEGELSGMWLLDPEELAAFANAVRKQTLLEAADEIDDGEYDHKWKAEELRRMAGVE